VRIQGLFAVPAILPWPLDNLLSVVVYGRPIVSLIRRSRPGTRATHLSGLINLSISLMFHGGYPDRNINYTDFLPGDST